VPPPSAAGADPLRQIRRDRRYASPGPRPIRSSILNGAARRRSATAHWARRKSRSSGLSWHRRSTHRTRIAASRRGASRCWCCSPRSGSRPRRRRARLRY